MKLLLILLALLPTLMLGGYTTEHIQKSCENYKQDRVRHLYRMTSYIPGHPAHYMDFYIMGQGLQIFECNGLIKQLEEDYK